MPKTIIMVLIITSLLSLFFFGNSSIETSDSDVELTAPRTTGIPAGIGKTDDTRIRNADSEPGNWLAYGRGYEERRFTPLTQINRDSIDRLGLAWVKDMGTNRALESTPIVVDEIVFFTSAWSIVYAVTAVIGEDIGSYDPEVPRELGLLKNRVTLVPLFFLFNS
jgi:glucose dehydrogenase